MGKGSGVQKTTQSVVTYECGTDNCTCTTGNDKDKNTINSAPKDSIIYIISELLKQRASKSILIFMIILKLHL
jgi:hypothetical protein